MIVSKTDFSDRELAAWWDDAYESDRLIRNTFFQSRVWNECWSEFFIAGDPRRELALLRVERNAAIVAAVPLFLQRRDAGPLTAWRYFLWIADQLAQYPDMVTTEADTTAVWDAVLHFLSDTYPDAWIQLRDVLPESTAAAIAAPGLARTEGESYLRLALRGQDETGYVQRCLPHMQREIHRARRLLASDEPLQWKAERNPTKAIIERLIEMNRERFGAASWFAAESNAVFFRTLCARAGDEVLFTVVEKEAEAVHIMASYLHGGTMHYVLSGMDLRYKKLSPGSMNLDRSIGWAMREGFAYFDFLRGDEPYKREFSPEERTSVDLEIPAASGNTRRAFARAAQRLRQIAGDG